jgi:deoxyribose-phosphate aldolase
MSETADQIAARRALQLLDLTDLADDCREAAVEKLCERAVTPYGHVAAICIWPQFVKAARARLARPVAVATVINFPAGGGNVMHAIEDAREALGDGADEIDLVMPYKALLRDDDVTVREMIEGVAAEVPSDKLLKVILETGALESPAMIRRASEIAIASGAHFIKTSTGKIAVSATPEAARIMLEVIKATPRPVGFKAAGGIRTLADAKAYLAIADEIMGPDWAKPATFRFGASGLLDALLAALDGRDAASSGGY